MLSRRGTLDFPLPLSPKGSQLRWRKEEIEQWNSSIGNTAEQAINNRKKI
jgi:predicted DNA-binding transcriptional regulator AlpA